MRGDEMCFLGGPMNGQSMSVPTYDDREPEGFRWPFQVTFDIPVDFNEQEILIGCARHVYQLLLTGEHEEGSEWAQYSHECSYPIEVKSTNT
jgi:hypothetical protein